LTEILKTVRESYDSGTITAGKLVGLLEEEVARFTETDYAVAVSSCTSALILALAALDLPEGSEVVVPSFTFGATVQPLLWNRLTPVYVDCLPGTMTVDPDQVSRAIGPGTTAICAVTIYGLPADLDALTQISRKHGIPLILDSAQGLGSTFEQRPTGGFGLCEAFSMSPTKVVTAVEGGMVTTNNHDLAAKVRSMRDYGKGPDGEEMIFNGLSARMSELHAAVGLLSLRNAEKLIRSRGRLIRDYREEAANLPGCRVQEYPENRTTSGNYFVLLIGPDAKATRDGVLQGLNAQDIQGKRYFHPPIHEQNAFRNRPHRIVGDLKNTRSAASEALALPLYSHMTHDEQQRVIDALKDILT